MPAVAERLDSPPALDPGWEQREDHIILLGGVTWSRYLGLLRSRGERALPRMAWSEGVLELMSPSFDHENVAGLIGRLLERWCEERGIPVNRLKSWTVRRQTVRRGAEADECYTFGSARKKIPDLVLEVVWTHGGLDMLDVWRPLGVPEVWIWEAGALVVWCLEGGRYVSSPRSRQLPDLDVALLARFSTELDQSAAVRAFLNASAPPV